MFLSFSVDSLFYTRKGALYLNQTVLAGRMLDRCEYKAITWESDSYYSYTEPLIRKEPPFEMKVKHDFFKIECYLKADKNSDADQQPKVENGHQSRKLLQLGNVDNVELNVPRIEHVQHNVWNEQQNIQGNVHQNFNNKYQNAQNIQYNNKANRVQNDGVNLEYRQSTDIGRKGTMQKSNNVQSQEIPHRQRTQPKTAMQYNSPNDVAFGSRNINDGQQVNYMENTIKKNDNIPKRLGSIAENGDTNREVNIIQPKESFAVDRSPVQVGQQVAQPFELHVNNDRSNGGQNAGSQVSNVKEAGIEPEKVVEVAATQSDRTLNKEKNEETDNAQEGDYDEHLNPNYDDGISGKGSI